MSCEPGREAKGLEVWESRFAWSVILRLKGYVQSVKGKQSERDPNELSFDLATETSTMAALAKTAQYAITTPLVLSTPPYTAPLCNKTCETRGG